MNESKTGTICVGEALVELARGADGRFALASGGDTFNTAIYLARAGLPVNFATALGDDPYSEAIVSLAAAEGVGTELMLRVAGRLPGLALGGQRQQSHFAQPGWLPAPLKAPSMVHPQHRHRNALHQ